jgi:WS/DGAT/MGAT family acyltransferase
MSSRDAGFLYLERPHALLHIGCVAVFEGALSRARLVECLEARLSRLRRYTQRATPVPLSLGHPTWEDDPEFSVQRHVQRWALPAPGGDAELREAVEALLVLPLDRDRPLWEMHVLEGLDGGRSALFQKVHHCMVDGMAGAQLLELILDAVPSDRQAPAVCSAPGRQQHDCAMRRSPRSTSRPVTSPRCLGTARSGRPATSSSRACRWIACATSALAAEAPSTTSCSRCSQAGCTTTSSQRAIGLAVSS